MDKNNKIEEYLNRYVFPLIGIPYRDINLVKYDYKNKESKDPNLPGNFVIRNNIEVYLYDKTKNTNDENPLFVKFALPFELDKETASLLNKCLESFYRNCFDKDMTQLSEKGEATVFRYCIDSAICSWIAGYDGRVTKQLEKLLLCLENWSVKTYEGHKVSFAFLYNPAPTKNNNVLYKKKIGSFLDFIDSDYGAVFTDGITSIIEIDSNCEFVNYHSITEGDVFETCILSKNIPYRFNQVISKYVEGEKVGIFLLNNGDIILAKSQEVFFVKRNNKWLNFRKSLFWKIISEKITDISSDLIESVFISSLDVSFAHNGGIIAVVDSDSDSWKKDVVEHIEKDDNESMVHELDLYNNQSSFGNKELCSLFDRTLKHDLDSSKNDQYDETRKTRNVRKRITKRKYVFNMIAKVIGEKKDLVFDNLDRRFKVEAIGLDGACIIDKNGSIISFGAIIKNDAGSSEGGRGAAAKKLSRYGGFAIKISTDGYIEVFLNDNNVYSIK